MPSNISGDTLLQVKKIVSNILGLPLNELNHNDRFIEELGADSLAMFELRMEFEKYFNIRILDEDVEHLATIENAANYILKRLKD
jgi:acyl carrier protein